MYMLQPALVAAPSVLIRVWNVADWVYACNLSKTGRLKKSVTLENGQFICCSTCQNVGWLLNTVCERQNICLKIPSFVQKTKTFLIEASGTTRYGTFGPKSIVSPIFTILPTLFNGRHEDSSTVARRSKPIIICTASLNTFFLDCTLKLILKKAMFGIFNILLFVYCIQLVVMSIQLHILESNLTQLPRWQVVCEDHLVPIYQIRGRHGSSAPL